MNVPLGITVKSAWRPERTGQAPKGSEKPEEGALRTQSEAKDAALLSLFRF